MKPRFSHIIAAMVLLCAGNPSAWATTYSLPLDTSVSISGPTIPGVWVEFVLDVSATAPSFGTPCGVGLSQCDPSTFNSLLAVLSVSTSISEYDQTGHLVQTTSLLSLFDNCVKPGVCGGFGRDQTFGPNASGFEISGPNQFVISTTIYSKNITSDEAILTMTLPDDISITPIPAGLPLFASGLGLIGLLLLRGSRKNSDVQLTATSRGDQGFIKLPPRS